MIDVTFSNAHASLSQAALNKWNASRLADGWHHILSEAYSLRIPQQTACSDYALNETRFHWSANAQYLMTRVGDKTYVARLNVHYMAKDVKPDEESNMRAKVAKCYSDAGFLDDGKGDRLRLMLVDPNSGTARGLTPAPVYLHDSVHREDDEDYALDTDCSTILHESMHLLGLWDEYKETESDMHCRALGTSIMDDQHDVQILAFDAATEAAVQEKQARFPDHSAYFTSQLNVKFQAFDQITCAHPGETDGDTFYGFKNDTTKQFEFDGIFGGGSITYDLETNFYAPRVIFHTGAGLYSNRVDAPEDFVRGYLHLDPKKWSCQLQNNLQDPMVKSGKELVGLKPLPMEMTPRNPPLRAAHFRKFVFPECKAKNQVYDTCTSEDYLVPSTTHQCMVDRFPICKSNRWLN